ncbi:MAG: class I SAM-dependent methyltransferase [Eubacterium sp.]|nr:class I SAM-dependent methyltransferase [Eubacterium sp.]
MIKLSKRLKACADLVREGSRLADVGCDHGYVPVYLVQSGKIRSAVACDIKEGPLSSCRSLVSDYSLGDKIKCVLSDGLKNVGESEADCILIAGMGGELISKILTECDYAKEKHIILNPMTHPELARKWLFENGFEIINDIIVHEDKHSYSVFDAEYSGEIKPYTDIDCFLGKINDYSDKRFFEHLLNYLGNKEKSGEDCSAVIGEIIRRCNNDNG